MCCCADESDELVETVAKGVGKTNTMIWQYVPAFVLLAKFAEVSAPDALSRDGD